MYKYLNKLPKKYLDHLIFSILALSIPFFFYKLGQSSLVSWDEAWYASISQNILDTGDLFHMIYNGALFADKPPGGFWVTAAFFKIFGVSTLTARLSSAILGFLSLYFLYFLGKKLFNRLVGFCAAVSLLSSYWFLYRARSGNLDAPLTFFYILTTFLAILASENKKFLIPMAISFGYLALIKGVVFAWVLIPVLVVIFWKNKIYKLKDFGLPFLISFGIFGLWILLQELANPDQALYHFTHSLRFSNTEHDYGKSLGLFKEYLHSGIGKWFWPGILAIIVGFFLKQRRFYILSVFFVSFSLPFIFSLQVHIWHLIPLHPIMILAIYGTFYVLGQRILASKYFKLNNVTRNSLLTLSMLVFAIYFSTIQLRSAWYQFIDIPAYISDEEILSTQAGKLTGKLYLDGDFDPAGAFYSHKIVTKLYNPDLDILFNSNQDFLLITNDWRLEKAKIDPTKYKLIKKDRDKVLIQRLIKD